MKIKDPGRSSSHRLEQQSELRLQNVNCPRIDSPTVADRRQQRLPDCPTCERQHCRPSIPIFCGGQHTSTRLQPRPSEQHVAPNSQTPPQSFPPNPCVQQSLFAEHRPLQQTPLLMPIVHGVTSGFGLAPQTWLMQVATSQLEGAGHCAIVLHWTQIPSKQTPFPPPFGRVQGVSFGCCCVPQTFPTQVATWHWGGVGQFAGVRHWTQTPSLQMPSPPTGRWQGVPVSFTVPQTPPTHVGMWHSGGTGQVGQAEQQWVPRLQPSLRMPWSVRVRQKMACERLAV